MASIAVLVFEEKGNLLIVLFLLNDYFPFQHI